MTSTSWLDKARALGPELAEHSARHDEDGTFVEESFLALKDEGFFKALVPADLGGGGAGMRDTCTAIRELARHCGSTALAFSMHTHLVAVTVWKHRHGKPGEALLRRIANDDLVLVSTGAGDWLDSNGVLEKVEGGYRYTSKKPFASGSPMADMMITSGRYDDPDDGPMVLHFPLSFDAEGVHKGSDWDTHGMRGTGSDTLRIEAAFVPEGSIAMRRPAGAWHPAFDVITTVALPIFMSAYVGLVDRAGQLALESAARRREDPNVQYLTGELRNHLFLVEALWNAHVDNTNELDFEPDRARTSRSAEGKTLLAASCKDAIEKAMELAGGVAFFRKRIIERLARDVRGGPYHPLQPKRQHLFSGRISLDLEPTSGLRFAE